MDTDNPLGELALDATEARVIGCLVEKEATTPDTYPLTVNALVVAANQKTSREPVMNLTPGEVGHALRQLDRRGLVKQVFGARADRWEHRVAEKYGVTRQQQALLALLLLRGAQTTGELLARSERLASFADAADLRHALDRMADREPPLVVRVPRGPGQREDRWMHLLSGAVDVAALAAAAPAPRGEAGSGLLERLEALEQRVAELEAALQQRTGGG
jgi:hypothetical protein